jgi:hypothetical protein
LKSSIAARRRLRRQRARPRSLSAETRVTAGSAADSSAPVSNLSASRYWPRRSAVRPWWAFKDASCSSREARAGVQALIATMTSINPGRSHDGCASFLARDVAHRLLAPDAAPDTGPAPTLDRGWAHGHACRTRTRNFTLVPDSEFDKSRFGKSRVTQTNMPPSACATLKLPLGLSSLPYSPDPSR